MQQCERYLNTKRTAILQAAIDFLQVNPPEKLRIAQIARHAGTDAKLVNYHFHSKNQLILEAFEVVIGHAINRHLNRSQPQALSGMLDAIRHACRENRPFINLMLPFFASQESALSESKGIMLERIDQQFVRVLTEQTRLVSSTADAYALIMLIVSAFMLPGFLQHQVPLLFKVKLADSADDEDQVQQMLLRMLQA